MHLLSDAMLTVEEVDTEGVSSPVSSLRDSYPPEPRSAPTLASVQEGNAAEGCSREEESPERPANGAPSSQAAASGLRWKNIGASRPVEGRELENSQLADALQTKTEFTPDEWDNFEIANVRENDFVKSRNNYFMPALPAKNYWGTLRCVHEKAHLSWRTLYGT